MENLAEPSVPCVRYAKTPVLYLAMLFERMAYYGLRSFMILFLIASVALGGAEIPREDALAFYGTFTAITYLAPFLSAALSYSLIEKHKLTFVGLIIALAGVALTYLQPTQYAVNGLYIAAFGFGMIKPLFPAMLAQQYADRHERMDSAFYWFYLAINLGALCAPLLIGYIIVENNYSDGFLAIMAAVAITAFTVLFACNRGYVADQVSKNKRVSNVFPLVVGLGLLMVFFWASYEYFFAQFYYFKQDLKESQVLPEVVGWIDLPIGLVLESFMAGATIIVCLSFALVFYRSRVNSGSKIAAGILALGLAWLAMDYAYANQQENTLLSWIILTECLFVFAELFFTPIIYSAIAKNSPQKHLVINFSLIMFFIAIANAVAARLGSGDKELLITASAGTIALALLVWLVSRLNTKFNRGNNSAEQSV